MLVNMLQRLVIGVGVIVLALSATGCRHIWQGTALGKQQDAAARNLEQQLSVPEQRLALAEDLAREGELEKAQEILSSLIGIGIEEQRVAALSTDINRQLAEKRQKQAGEHTATEAFRAKQRVDNLRAANQKLLEAEMLVKMGRLDEAELAIGPLQEQGVFPQDTQRLAAEIGHRRAQLDVKQGQEQSAKQALLEVQQRFVLPEAYGRTVTIAGDATPREYPPGPMEELVKRKVTMRLQNAGVKDIVQALSEIDGLNIVADQALTEQQRITVNVKDVPLSELLSYIARNMGVAFHLGANTVWVTQSAEPPGSGPKLETRVYSLRQGLLPQLSGGGGGGGSSLSSRISGSGSSGVDSAFAALSGSGSGSGGGGSGNSGLEQALATFLADGPDGSTYQVYRDRNVVIIRNSIENLRLAEELIREFDLAPKQVLIEARFVTIRDTDLLEFGFDVPEFSLEGKSADAKAEILTMDAESLPKAFANAATGGNITVTGILGNHTYKAVMHALKEEGKSKTLSAPRVTVVNNQRARLRRGQLMYYFEEYDVAGVSNTTSTTTTVVPSGTPTELELGVTLDVQVNVGNDGRTVMLALAPIITDFAGWENYTTAGDGSSSSDSGNTTTDNSTALIRLPKVNESSVQTTVVVNSGETVVLGGMLYNSEEHGESKVPWLGDIPIFGWLFKHATTETKPEHLLIFVTATVIGPSGEFQQALEPAAAK
ncbi:MAG: hypothetical protein A3K19_17510 [Lentisphaerae bacterium RIFOXYB12_FULL_65_16]|nr:MAG: hypothetical protein A3K18_12445 [Lentisphaerae bacterium RIFOXYA12_64_32]OGV85598.1 MAG: hypothetical protein A3K19_17510 [Lentisphaerae bacterium RIFOXYB12_FULL_65_16]